MATYYFRNVGTDWGTAANWSLTNGGGATGAVPTASDDALFTINSGNCTSSDSWNKLIQMGFKPRPCQRVNKIYCSNSGLDVLCASAIMKQTNQTTVRTSNTSAPNAGGGVPGSDYNPQVFAQDRLYQSFLSLTSLKWRKHSYIDTEDVCQWTGVPNPDAGTQPIAVRTEMPKTSYDTLDLYFSQGYDCIPFGSAIIFRVRQYAPPQLTVPPDTPSAGNIVMTHTCVRQIIPLDVYLDSVTTFKGPVEGRFDLDLPYSNPGVSPPI